MTAINTTINRVRFNIADAAFTAIAATAETVTLGKDHPEDCLCKQCLLGGKDWDDCLFDDGEDCLILEQETHVTSLSDIFTGRPENALPSEATLGVIEFEMANQKVKPARRKDVFTGKVVAFTGTLQVGTRKMQRTEAQQIVKALGGNVVVGEYGKIRNANLLVLGKQAGNRTQSQKMDAARKDSVPTITAEQFFSMIG